MLHLCVTPFAFLFMMGYGGVAWLVSTEQLGQRRPAADRVSSGGVETAAAQNGAGIARAA